MAIENGVHKTDRRTPQSPAAKKRPNKKRNELSFHTPKDMEVARRLLETDSTSRTIISGTFGASMGAVLAYIRTRAVRTATVAAACAEEREHANLATLLARVISSAQRSISPLKVDPVTGVMHIESPESLKYATSALWSLLAFIVSVLFVFVVLAASPYSSTYVPFKTLHHSTETKLCA